MIAVTDVAGRGGRDHRLVAAHRSVKMARPGGGVCADEGSVHALDGLPELHVPTTEYLATELADLDHAPIRTLPQANPAASTSPDLALFHVQERMPAHRLMPLHDGILLRVYRVAHSRTKSGIASGLW